LKKNLAFAKASYIKSALAPNSWPLLTTASGLPMKEIAIVGRSNVGKSSLLNNLFLNSKLAKVSSTPGKTNTLNFFLIDETIALVDLPGYGYAKVSKQIKSNWSEHLNTYLKTRSQITLLLLLLDIRREPSADDQALIEWSAYHQKPLLVIFTKCDKVNQEEQKKNSTLALNLLSHPIEHCFYSIKNPKSRIHLIDALNRYI
jgi:GTP-binding protein